MKTIITTLSLAFTLTLSAQTKQAFEKSALEEITADKFLAGGNAVDYDRLPRKALTPTPKGYEPYYFSHYGRHGARWLLNERDRSFSYENVAQGCQEGWRAVSSWRKGTGQA